MKILYRKNSFWDSLKIHVNDYSKEKVEEEFRKLHIKYIDEEPFLQTIDFNFDIIEHLVVGDYILVMYAIPIEESRFSIYQRP